MSTVKSDKTIDMFSTNQKSETTKILVSAPSSKNLVKELFRNHGLMFLCFVIVKIYIECIWYVNIYTLQKASSGEHSKFHNGMILGTVSFIAFTSVGFIGKFFDNYNA